MGRNLNVWHASIGVVLLALRIGWASKGNHYGPTVFGAQQIVGRDGSLACMAMFRFKH